MTWHWPANHHRNRTVPSPLDGSSAGRRSPEARHRASILATQVNRYLDEAKLQPHRSRYWVNAKEKDPEKFQGRSRQCALLSTAPGLYENRTLIR